MSTLSSAGMSPGMHSTLTEVMICWSTPSLNSVTAGDSPIGMSGISTVELLAQVDREEIDVHQLGGARVDLQLADQHLAGAAAVEREIDQVAVAGAVPDLSGGCARRSTSACGSTLCP